MKYALTLFLTLLACGLLLSQEFHTTFYLSNDQGLLDSVTIGFDPEAADGIDPTYGEQDLLHLPMADFELRTGQVYNERMTYFEDLEHPVLDSLAQYAGKTEIIPKECSYFLPVSNQAGFLPSITLFIKTDTFPVVLKWDKQAFENACVQMSFLTDWPITSWWDIPCCPILDLGRIHLADTDSITLFRHSGIQLIDNQGDSLIMLTILLNDELGSPTTNVEETKKPLSYPNPSYGSITIPDDWTLMGVSNSSGSTIHYRLEGTTVHTNFTGLLLLTLRKGSEIKVLKQINVMR